MANQLTPATDPVIRVHNVSKTFKLPHERVSSLKSVLVNFYRRRRTYETQQALQDVSFEVERGDFFAIIGRNGSGKSTLLKLLAGIYSPNSGDLRVDGVLTPFIELGVGFNHELTGRENVFLNGALLGFTHAEMQVMYNDIVEFAELERFMDQKLKNYSSGMQVRLAFSIAIRAQGDILLLDEVLAVGDAAFQQKCYSYFEELKEQKKTVVLVSHDMGVIKRFCTKAIYIDKGRLTHQGNAAKIADIYTADNLAAAEASAAKDRDRPPTNHTVRVKIMKQQKDQVTIKVSYKSDRDDVYVGLAIMKDNVSIAEISTPSDMSLPSRGALTYTLDLKDLNGGVYMVDAALFARKNRELLAFAPVKAKFAVDQYDPTKGAAIKLAHTWKQA